MNEIKNKLIEIAGRNVLASDLKEIRSLTKCVNYLITQLIIIDESDGKERSAAILENVPKFLNDI